jgi:protocatechuate 3,4-dioxygenase beta subunit
MARRIDSADRRRLLQAIAMSAAWWSVPGAYAEQLVRTPAQTEGPFYPNHLPLDTDNDLIRINDLTTPAVGAITWLSGRVLDLKGEPVRNALVEIWQVDNAGAYIHTGSVNRDKRDANFQGFGRFLTGSTGEYLFRTIKPVPYPGRTPHIHVAVKTKGREKFTTQCYVKGEPQNDKDGILQRTENRDALIVPFMAMPGSPSGDLAARFDIVLGFTPAA